MKNSSLVFVKSQIDFKKWKKKRGREGPREGKGEGNGEGREDYCG